MLDAPARNLLDAGWDPRKEADKFLPYMPERNVSAQYPPTILIHGEADTDVPFASSARMAEQLKRYGVEHRLLRFPGAEHGLPNADQKQVGDAYRAAAAFVVKQFETP